MANLIELTAHELADLYKEGRTSPKEVIKAVFNQADRHEPQINAFCWLDPDIANNQASESELRWRRGEQKSSLDGVPITVKDNLHVSGMPARFGSKALQSAGASMIDSPSVARLREAGAVIFGKTCLPDFAHKIVTDSPLTGITRNPYNLKHTPGGSSGGACAAVAARIGAAALGSDGGGSIRIPAAFTGTFGFKPSFGRVPHYPRGPFAPLSHVGPITRSVRDAAMLMDVISRPDHRDWYALPFKTIDYLSGFCDHRQHDVKIAVSETLGLSDGLPDEDIRRCLRKAATAFEDLGFIVEEAAPPGIDKCSEIHGIMWMAFSAFLAHNLGDGKQVLDPSLQELAQKGAHVSTFALLQSLSERGELGAQVNEFFASYNLLLCPVYPTLAPALDRRDGPQLVAPRFTSWCNQLGLPAASIYCGIADNGLPIGIQVVGPQYSDSLVIAASYALEHQFGIAPYPSLPNT